MRAEQTDTLIIGAGQAGLAMSHMLRRRGCEHLVLERRRIAERWRSERWDGLRFQFPNWSISLPDFPFGDADPDGFAASGQVVNYLAAYARFVDAPVRCGVAVTRLRQRAGRSGFVARTPQGAIEAENVVVATGPYQRRSSRRCSTPLRPSSSTRAAITGPSRFPPVPCSSSARAPPARRSPRSSRAQAAASFFLSVATAACRAAIAAAISSGG
jgi:glycine/D-amino acid oxidase-like deaminating enzyme